MYTTSSQLLLEIVLIVLPTTCGPDEEGADEEGVDDEESTRQGGHERSGKVVWFVSPEEVLEVMKLYPCLLD